MSDSIETKGKTVDLAVSEALLQLGLRRDEVEIKVLEEPRAGLMGFLGKRQAKVLVTKRRSRGGSRFGGRGGRRDDEHRAHDLTADSSSGRGRDGKGGRDGGGRDRGREGGRDERGGRSENRGGRDGAREGGRDSRDGRGGRDARSDARSDVRNEARGGREGARSDNRGPRDGRDRVNGETPAPRPREEREETADGQRSRRRRGGRGRGGRGRSETGAPREAQQPNGSVAFDAADDTFEVAGAPAAAPDREEGGRSERGGDRGRRGGRGGGRGRGGERGDERAAERGNERAGRDQDEAREASAPAEADEFVVNEAPDLGEAVPRQQAREQRSRRELHVAAAGADAVEGEAGPAVESEVIETAVVVNVALRAKPKAWGGLGARRAKPGTGSALPRVEQESPATAGAVFKPARTKHSRAVADRAAAAAQVGEVDAPRSSSTPSGGSAGYDAPRSYRGGADEVIATGIAATDYAKALTAVDEAGQPALLTELTTGMLARAGFPCECETIPGEYHAVKVSVDEDSAGMLIGRGGSTAEAVEHLVERMASNAAGDRVRMNLDINDYRIRREDGLRERAAEAIADVRATGEAYHMEPMDARERRVVHLLAEEMPDITTYTVIDSGGKHVVIARSDDDGQDDDGQGGNVRGGDDGANEV
jgi:predicted RNA-binding protein Jag